MSFQFPWSAKKTSFSKPGQTPIGEKGQIVVEYILLLVASVGLAVLITSYMVSRNPEEPGFLVSKWMEIVRTIGQDVVDEVDQ